jgi:hypothetical protein
MMIGWYMFHPSEAEHLQTPFYLLGQRHALNHTMDAEVGVDNECSIIVT